MSTRTTLTSIQGTITRQSWKVELYVFKLQHLPRTLLMTRPIMNTGQKSIRSCTHARIREREATFHWGSYSGLWSLAQGVSNWILGNTSAQSFLGQTMKLQNCSYHKTQRKGITMRTETSYWSSTTNKGKTLLLLKGYLSLSIVPHSLGEMKGLSQAEVPTDHISAIPHSGSRVPNTAWNDLCWPEVSVLLRLPVIPAVRTGISHPKPCKSLTARSAPWTIGQYQKPLITSWHTAPLTWGHSIEENEEEGGDSIKEPATQRFHSNRLINPQWELKKSIILSRPQYISICKIESPLGCSRV